MRMSNKETEYICLCGNKFKLKKKVLHIPSCSSCAREKENARNRKKKYYLKKEYRERIHNNTLKTKYGIDKQKYNELLKQQDGVCAICKRSNIRGHRLVVDHDHLSGKVRGLLCHNCNMTLGKMRDNLSLFKSCLSYLTQHLNYTPPTWDEFFLKHVYLVSSKSKDPSTQIGAVLVKNNILISEGYNGFCRNVNDNISERWMRPEKYFWVEHGERNAIFNAARNGVETFGSTIFTNGMPCVDCARSIIQAGIKEVVLHEQWEKYWREIMKDKWKEHDAISAKMFEEAGVNVRYVDKILNQKCLIAEKVCSV